MATKGTTQFSYWKDLALYKTSTKEFDLLIRVDVVIQSHIRNLNGGRNLIEKFKIQYGRLEGVGGNDL